MTEAILKSNTMVFDNQGRATITEEDERILLDKEVRVVACADNNQGIAEVLVYLGVIKAEEIWSVKRDFEQRGLKLNRYKIYQV